MLAALIVADLRAGGPPPAGMAHQLGEAVARSLASLVEGVVDGIVGRTFILATSDDPMFRHIADEAGCGLVHHLAELPVLPAPDWLVLPAGALLPSGWSSQLKDELRRVGPVSGRVLSFRANGADLWTRLMWSLDRGLLPAGGVVPAVEIARLLWSPAGLRSKEPLQRLRFAAGFWRG